MGNLLEQIVYHSEAMQQVRRELGPYIESATPILFWGETGSGMGFYAKAIHETSAREGEFIQIPGFSLDKDTVKQQFLGLEEKSGWLEEAEAREWKPTVVLVDDKNHPTGEPPAA